MARLTIQIDAIARLRESGKNPEADPVRAGLFAELGGADSIACVLPDDQSPLLDRDVKLLKETLRAELILLVPAADAFTTRAMGYGPSQVVLIPPKKAGSTQGGGLDAIGQAAQLSKLVQDFRSQSIQVKLLVEPMIQQVKAAAKLNADGVLLHLGQFGKLKAPVERSDYLDNLNSVAMAGHKMELSVAIGNGITYQSISEIMTSADVDEVVGGDAVIARALWIGMESAVRDMCALVR